MLDAARNVAARGDLAAKLRLRRLQGQGLDSRQEDQEFLGSGIPHGARIRRSRRRSSGPGVPPFPGAWPSSRGSTPFFATRNWQSARYAPMMTKLKGGLGLRAARSITSDTFATKNAQNPSTTASTTRRLLMCAPSGPSLRPFYAPFEGTMSSACAHRQRTCGDPGARAAIMSPAATRRRRRTGEARASTPRIQQSPTIAAPAVTRAIEPGQLDQQLTMSVGDASHRHGNPVPLSREVRLEYCRAASSV